MGHEIGYVSIWEGDEVFNQGGLYVEVVGPDGTPVVWKFVRDHIMEEPKDNNVTGLQVVEYLLFDDCKEVEREKL